MVDKWWLIDDYFLGLPSGKRLHNYGQIHHCLMGKSTISMAIFNSYVSLPEGKIVTNGDFYGNQYRNIVMNMVTIFEHMVITINDTNIQI